MWQRERRGPGCQSLTDSSVSHVLKLSTLTDEEPPLYVSVKRRILQTCPVGKKLWPLDRPACSPVYIRQMDTRQWCMVHLLSQPVLDASTRTLAFLCPEPWGGQETGDHKANREKIKLAVYKLSYLWAHFTHGHCFPFHLLPVSSCVIIHLSKHFLSSPLVFFCLISSHLPVLPSFCRIVSPHKGSETLVPPLCKLQIWPDSHMNIQHTCMSMWAY